MSNNGPAKGSPALDALLAACTTPEQVLEATHKFYGIPNEVDYRQERPSFAPIVEPPAPMSASAQQGNSHTHERVIYPLGNDRYVLTGFSDEDLDRKEAAIKAALGVR